jgi:hypothetical protein
MEPTNRRIADATCGRCAHFQNDPAALEKAFPGLTSMCSGFASVRAQDGLCRQHGIYLSAWDSCPSFLLDQGAET